MQRYFVLKKDNNLFKIKGDDYHHIVNVMRLKINDKIEVVYNNIVYLSLIEKIENNIVYASMIDIIESNSELSIDVTIAQALVKEDKFNYILQKGTELGVKSFIPVAMERSIVKLDQNKALNKLNRWQKICKEASEQSKRIIISQVKAIKSINDLTKLDYDYKILCSVNEEVRTIKKVLQDIKINSKIIVVIGPEGGLTHLEEKKLIDNGYIRVSLGNRVLRTETASLFIMSLINYELMR
ncbi:MAG: RsmE family RNA methyltransferase [Bacilli bacterium]|nr:RsmE family RNA methyltransferase [Bacilli bacterium]